LEEAGPRKSPISVPDSDGLADGLVKDTIVLPFNDSEILENTIKKRGHEVAALIAEPILHGNATCIPPEKGFLKTLRETTAERGIVLIFDEVVTGFRHSLGGAQKLFKVTPDLTTFGKAMANGFPVAAICGKEDIMKEFKPTGKVEYGGTFNGNPIGMSATLATIQELEKEATYKRLFKIGERIRKGFNEVIFELKIKAQAVGFGSVFQIVFTDRRIRDYRDTLAADAGIYRKFQEAMMSRGFFVLPHANKRSHLCVAHTEEDIDRTIENARDVLIDLRRQTRRHL